LVTTGRRDSERNGGDYERCNRIDRAGRHLAARAAHEHGGIRGYRASATVISCAALLEELKDNIAAVDAWAPFPGASRQVPAIEAHAEELKGAPIPKF
jgi:hypothetical protein